MTNNCFRIYKKDVSAIPLPDKFTFPFFYDPHPLAIMAAEELQAFLENKGVFQHNFGLDTDQIGLEIGKMFGVLVVQNEEGQLGYLRAFSGKLANSNHHEGFVPPVFDILDSNGFFLKEEDQVNAINSKLEQLENNVNYNQLKNQLIDAEVLSKLELATIKKESKLRKKHRDEKRLSLTQKKTEEQEDCFKELQKESIEDSYREKRCKESWKIRIEEIRTKLTHYEFQIEELKQARKEKSAALQQRIFEAYTFLNSHNESKSLLAIFGEDILGKPPAGAGECAAPKLLHYAYINNLKPIALAEFWWGKSPLSEVRQHKNYYPACKGKCEPILGHMLKGLAVDENPLLVAPSFEQELDIIYEDEVLIIVNKPVEFLSVPGKNITDSVLSRLRIRYPDATGPILVHRLDMSTSGILVGTKTEMAHKFIQSQFIKRTVEKRYEAILDGVLEKDFGTVTLAMEQDFLNRPRQMVTPNGKPAVTAYKVIEVVDNKTRVHFYPKTGRTHQLRVHAAHVSGLNAPIVGDDLYGKKANRLHLHAGKIKLVHPLTKSWVTFKVKAEF